jgi:hypothetical protein
MNLVQVLHIVQIANDFAQQQILIAMLEKLSQTRFLLVRRYSNDEIKISFSTIDETKLATALTNVELYNSSKIEIELVEKKKGISVHKDVNSFLSKCRLMIWNLYDALHLGNYRENSMSTEIIELIINELETLFDFGLHLNSSSDELMRQTLIDKLKLSSEDEVVKATRSIRLLVPMRNAFAKLFYFKSDQEVDAIDMLAYRSRSYAKLAELQTKIEMIKRCFDNSYEVSLFLPEKDKGWFYGTVEVARGTIRRVEERSTNDLAKALRYIRYSVNALAQHRAPNQIELMPSYYSIRTLIENSDNYSVLLNEDAAYLRQYLKQFDCLKPIYDVMTKLKKIISFKSINIIEYFIVIITDTNDESSVDKSCDKLTWEFAKVPEALREVQASRDKILQIIDDIVESINEFSREHDDPQFQLLLDDRKHLEEFRNEVDTNFIMVETQFVPSYMRAYELAFRKSILAHFTKFNYDDSNLSEYTSGLLRFIEYFKYEVKKIASFESYLSQEQFISIQEMIVTCLECLVFEFSKYNNNWLKKISKDIDVSELNINYRCLEIIKCEQDIEEIFLLPESKRGIISKGLIQPLALQVRLIINYVTAKQLIARSTELRNAHVPLFDRDDDGDIKLTELELYYDDAEKNFTHECSRCGEDNEFQVSYKDSIRKLKDAKRQVESQTRIIEGIGRAEPEMKGASIGFLITVIAYFVIMPIVFIIIRRHSLNLVLKDLVGFYKLTYVKITFPLFAAISLAYIIYRIVRSIRYKAITKKIGEPLDESLVEFRGSAFKAIDDFEQLLLQQEAHDCSCDLLQQTDLITSEPI